MHDWGWENMMWIVWIPIIVLIAWLVVTLTKKREPNEPRNETPLEILKRRYANGEINIEEYDERKKKLKE